MLMTIQGIFFLFLISFSTSECPLHAVLLSLRLLDIGLTIPFEKYIDDSSK